ncbi:MAG: hypothetical protein NVSMB30_18600 [Hymenobacter sp.]
MLDSSTTPNVGNDLPDAGPHAALLALRARAEKRRHLVTQAAEHHTPEETQRLVQELQIHQIELEMQYEELLLAQTEAQAARDQYLDLYDFAPVGYFTLSEGGLIRQLNLSGSQLLGAVRQRLVGRRLALFVAPHQRLEFGKFLARVFSSDSTQSCELQLQREDGTLFYAQLEGLRTETTIGPQCRLAVIDTTLRHHASEALAASEARFRKLFADSNDAVVLVQGSVYADCNEAALRLLGARHQQQVLGQPIWAHTPELQPDGRRTADLFRENLATAIRTGSQRCEALIRRLSGEEIWVEAVLTPIELGGATPLVHIVWRDITAARAAQVALRLSQERLQMALAASASGVWLWEVADNQLYWDENAQAVFGLPFNPEPVSFEVLRAAVHEADRALLAAGLRRAFAEHVPFELEHRVRWPDGRVRYAAALGKAQFDERGRPLRLVGIMRDVTPRREAEAALLREKEFTESLLDNSVDGLIALDRDARITAWNTEAARYFGQGGAAVLGRPLFEVLPYLDEEALRMVERALAGERITRLGRVFPGRAGHYDVYGVPLQHQGEARPSGVLITIRDVTERDRLAAQATQLSLRRQQEVLAAILATQETERKRIAEALHNGLGQVLYATKLHLDQLDTPALQALPVLAGLRQQTDRLLAEAMRQTRTLAHELVPTSLLEFGLAVAVRDVCRDLSTPQLLLECQVWGEELPLPQPVQVTLFRLAQELAHNIVRHAGATQALLELETLPNWVSLRAEDNGRGFDPRTVAEGLGLRTVRQAVALLGGTVAVDSSPDFGTHIRLRIPLPLFS